jgi:adenylate kinase
MKEIVLQDKTFIQYIPREEIDRVVKRLAREVEKDASDVPVFVITLKGGFMFGSDFAKHYNKSAVFDFIRLKSYENMESTGKVEIILDVTENISGKEVYVLEDIVDTGNTLEHIITLLKQKNPKFIKIVTLFYKPEAYKKEFPVDFVGFEIPKKFIVGYGLDYNEQGRNLSEVYQLKI